MLVRVRHCAVVPHFVLINSSTLLLLTTLVVNDILLSSIPLAAPRHLGQRRGHHSPNTPSAASERIYLPPVELDEQAKLEGLMTAVHPKMPLLPRQRKADLWALRHKIDSSR